MSDPEGKERKTRWRTDRRPVFVASQPNYNKTAVEQAVRDLLEAASDGEQLIQPGMTVLVKPNMLSDRDPEEGVITHPVVLEAVVHYAQSCGARVLIGDSPPQLHGTIRRFWRRTRYQEVAERTGAELVSFETGGVTELAADGFRFHVSNWVTEKADLVVNVAKLKTHNLTLLTAAVKNMFGCIPGGEKGDWHRRAPHPDDFSRVLVQVCEKLRPAVSLIDGIVGMVGNGPAQGDRVELGVLLASRDPYGLDVVAAAALGYDPAEVPTIAQAAAQGLGPVALREVEMEGVGGPAVPLPLGKFSLPSIRVLRGLPRPVLNFFGKRVWIHPGVDKAKCTRCGTCADNCPVGAITMVDYPSFDYEVCIDCWCCAESCPEDAILIKKSLLAKLLT